MDTDLQHQLQQRLSELPADVRAAIQSSDLDKQIQIIGQKHSLHIDQIGRLKDETLMVMLGFSDPGEFEAHVKESLQVSADAATAIATNIVQDIFMPIRKSMQEWVEQKAEQTNAEETSAAMSVLQKAPGSRLPDASPIPPAPSVQTVIKPAPKNPPAPASATDVSFSAADDVLLKPVVQTAAAASANTKPPASEARSKPQPYKADPYREPIEP